MAYLLRKFSLTKWQKNIEKSPCNYDADAITGCTRTRDNKLSVWHSVDKDFESDEVKDLIVALAISMDEPATMDVVFLEEDWLIKNDIKIKAESATTSFERVNGKHKDLVCLDHRKLGLVSQHIVEQATDEKHRKKLLKSQIITLVTTWIQKSDTFEVEHLKPRWQKQILKKLNSLKVN